MKHLLSFSLSILLFSGIGCTEQTEVIDPAANQSCSWGGAISNAKAASVLENWQKKWEFPASSGIENSANIPDSFFINRTALDGLIKTQCGFRAYFALTTPGDITSLGLVITAINDHDSDQIHGEHDKILFSSISNPDQMVLNDKTKEKEFPISYLSLEEAKVYTSNWRHYNQICLENVELGNSTCTPKEIQRSINPRGSLGKEIKQVVPLGLAFATSKFNEFMSQTYPKTSAYILYPCMYPLEAENGSTENVGYRYDLFARGYFSNDLFSKSSSNFTNRNPSRMGAFNVTGHCPPFCNIDDTLQRDECC